jgi:hypothetical protein
VSDAHVSGMAALSERLLHPVTLLEFNETIQVFQCYCTVLSVVPPMVLFSIFHNVVFKNLNVATATHPWQFVYALLLINLTEIDTKPNVTFGNVVSSGSMDYFRSKARAETDMMYPGWEKPIFRGSNSGGANNGGAGSSTDNGGGGGNNNEKKYNGKCNKTSTQ